MSLLSSNVGLFHQELYLLLLNTQGFTDLSKEYGDIFSVRLGSTDCVVVNNTELRDEVLIAKANDFDGRPNFERFRKLFGGEKQHCE